MRQIERILLAVVFVSNAGILGNARGDTIDGCPAAGEAEPEAYALELPAPNVVIAGSPALQASLALTGEGDGCPISSEDWPFSCVPVEIGPILVEVRLQRPIRFEGPQSPLDPTYQPFNTVCTQLFVDGQPVGRRSHVLPAQHAANETLATFTIPCPKPGRHLLQARYLVDNRWSLPSRILCIDVHLPRAPEIIALGESTDTLNPVAGEGAVTITTDTLRFRLANCQPSGTVAVYLDKVHVGDASVFNCATPASVDIAGRVPPGYYELTLRSRGRGRLASPSSRAVPIHYQPADGYFHEEKSPAPKACEEPPRPEPTKRADGQKPANEDCILSARLAAAGLVAADEAFRNAAAVARDSRNRADTARAKADDLADVAERAANAHAVALAKRDRAVQREAEASKDAGDRAESARAGRDNAEKELAGVAADYAQAKIAAARAAEAARRADAEAQADAVALRAGAERCAAIAARIATIKRAAAIEALGEAEVWSWLGFPRKDLRELNAHAEEKIKAAAEAELEARRRAAALRDASRALGEDSAPRPNVEHAAAPEGAQPKAPEGESGTATDGAPAPKGAFRLIPTPHPIPIEGETDSAPEPESDAGDDLKDPRVFRFLSTAHFPQRDFGPRGEVYDRTGAMIYEGMRFAADDEGNYEVSFVVAAPAMPTVLRLRFLVETQGEDHIASWHTITLPPIRIEPKQAPTGEYKTGIWRIRHQGYSAAIDAIKKNKSCWKVHREGTARFGFGPALVRRQ